ncbi:unnamed protein product [Rotaria sp. Silwood1]|nr:unnamed protein product [Rotaria sp. Silwood1]CAF3761065.1 unnamed protein product [Rotaria sp. Silwood1]CAF4577129.1 unnamed protein product [Rotaria sp. Silwood1]
MASATNLEERFNAAVKTIQNLPATGIIQLSNSTKLNFYGLYKQATLGPCKDSQPSFFNYIARAKWDAWNRYRSMTKEQAMLEYIDEIEKIIKTMPQTNEVLEFSQLIGLSNKSIDDQSNENDIIVISEKEQDEIIEENLNKQDSIETLISKHNHSNPSLLSSTSSSIISSNIDEFYDDPSGFISLTHDEIISDNNHHIQQQSINSITYSSHIINSQNVTNSIRPAINAISSGIGNTTNNSNRETQRTILTALTKLQRDINNILERLNRLETSTNLLQQKELLTSLKLNSSLSWLPLSGLRREIIVFILFWPFVAFILMRLFIRAKISIRFRRQHL